MKDWLCLLSPWLAFIGLIIWDTREKPSESKLKDPLILFTAILALGTVALAIVAFLQWETLEKTDQTLRAEQRPWVSLQAMNVASDLIWNSDGGHMTIQFVLKNSGHSPAIRVWANSRAFLMFGSEPNPQTSHNKLCEETRKLNVGDAIFPGDSVIQLRGLDFARADVNLAMNSRFKILIPMVLICVNYRFIGEASAHQSTYIFSIKRKPYVDRDGRPSVALNADEKVPSGEIVFERFVVGFDAD